MSEALVPTQFTVLGTGAKMVITLRSNIVRVSPTYRVLLLRLISTNSSDRTTMNNSVGRRGMTSTGTAIYHFRPEQKLRQRLLDRNLPQQVEIRQHLPGAPGH